MKLIIVESPTKARTIGQFLGANFRVESSFGHIRDLPKSNKKAIDIDGGFIPHYETSKGKEKVISQIKKDSKSADEVILATDPDREGEAIAWHIKEACELENPKRVVFHEITEEAIKEALDHPRSIDENLRRAQEARRVLDRLVGYDLSGLIWKKVRYGLSAGRVQSPALRIIMEKEREIRAFVPEKFWVITGDFATDKKEKINLTCDEKPKTEEEARNIIENVRKGSWSVVEIKQTETKRSPYAPFTTSTLQQAASSRLGYSPSYTMSIAQKLYEHGFITYMRTDSVHIGDAALAHIHGEIEKQFGKEYLAPRAYITKSKTAQEAHEAIRPTHIEHHTIHGTNEQKKLYNLISRRAITSQMSDARILRTKISACTRQNNIPQFSATGNITVFHGWLKADPEARGEEIELPKLKVDEPLTLLSIQSEEKQTEPPPRYTEAGLVKELEKREIGRPSTYATILKTLSDRGYVEKIGRSLKPTDTGEVVSSFLEQNFANYISDSFTAEMELELDQIADGKREYGKTLKDFYGPFSKDVKAKDGTKRLTNLGAADPSMKCPICGKGMVIKLARNGKFLSCMNFPICKGARKTDGTEMEGPKETGEMCPECGATDPPAGGGKLVEREGRYGKFISCSRYPKCKYIKTSPEEEAKKKTGVTCPECRAGEIVERRGRFGAFYSCSNYPKCKFAIKTKPTGAICPVCNSLMMQGTKTIPDRCSNKSCPNHRPDKVAKK